MKFKSLVLALTAALVGGAAAADTLTPVAVDVQNGVFSDVLLGTITLTQQSNVSGSILAATSISFENGWTLPLKSVTFSFAGLNGVTDLDSSTTGFSYANLAAGTYQLFASGSIFGSGATNAVVLSGEFAVSPAPEPATYALMLAGVGAIGFAARRRANKQA